MPDRNRSSILPLVFASIGLAVLALALLTAPSATVTGNLPGSQGEVVEAVVERIVEEGQRDRGGRPLQFVLIDVRLTEGSASGSVVTVEEEAIDAIGGIREFHPGDRVLVSYTRAPDGSDRAYIVEYVRNTRLALLAAAFAVAIGLVGGIQGLRSLLGMGLSFLIILRFTIPHILAGNNPILVGVLGAMMVLVGTLYLSHGFNLKTTAALAGTVVALALTGVLGQAMISWLRLTGLNTEEAASVGIQTGGVVQLTGLLLAGLLIGTLGVLDDVAVAQASAVFELHDADPRQGTRALITRGMRIGRDHIASTVNTLFLAYAGASLPLLILLSGRPEPLGTLINREFIAADIMQALVGSLGLVAAVPVTTALAAALVVRYVPAGSGGGPARPGVHRH